MTNPMIRIHNQETGEIIDREMNAEELFEWNKVIADNAEIAAAEAQKAADKAALLQKLGISESEAALLLS